MNRFSAHVFDQVATNETVKNTFEQLHRPSHPRTPHEMGRKHKRIALKRLLGSSF
ncbi:MAG: hypothetical protein JOZ71_08385 [Ktedonobacteraceae bacterium]|nr:hypothetical protein [Ktedonobacteraceae bacterium]